MSSLVVIDGITARLRGFFGKQADGSNNGSGGQRMGPYGEIYAVVQGSPKSALAEEGSYFTANNAQTGLATAAAPTAFSATNPFILIQNSAAPGAGGPIITLDYAYLANTVLGTQAAGLTEISITKDVILRYSSGGSLLTPVRSNSAGPGSIAQIYAGNITALAATGAASTLTGLRIMKNGTVVLADSLMLQFGSMDSFMQLYLATSTFSEQAVSPLVLNPGESGLIHLILTGQSGASSWAPELGWWEK